MNNTFIKIIYNDVPRIFFLGSLFVTQDLLGNNLVPMDQNLPQFSPLSLEIIFLIGLIADRYFNAEKILGILHLAGALMYQMYQSEEGLFTPIVF
jgi:hypothetical protein